MKKIVCITLLATLVCACQQTKEKQQGQTSLSFEAERNAFFNTLKSPAETAEKLKATSVAFNASLMSDPKNFASYASNPIKAAANLGIYLSDLNYCVAYQETAHTTELFKAAYELSKVMGLEKGVLDFLMKRYADNIARNDSIKAVVNSLFDNSTKGQQGTERERLVGIAMAAYQIENLHLALGLIEAGGNDPNTLQDVYQLVVHQKSNIEITYGFLQSITDITEPDKNPNYPFYANALKELINVYKRMPIENEKVNAKRIELVNDVMIHELMDKVNSIRNKIISIE